MASEGPGDDFTIMPTPSQRLIRKFNSGRKRVSAHEIINFGFDIHENKLSTLLYAGIIFWRNFERFVHFLGKNLIGIC